MAIPEMEIQNILTFLAYKTNKPVTFRWYTEDEGYSENSTSVRVAVSDGLCKTSKTDTVRLGEKHYALSESQVMVDIDVEVPEEKRILDDDFLTLAYVDHNRIVVPIELTATNNEEGRALLAYIVERAIELLDFKMSDKLLEQSEKLSQQFCEAFARGVQRRINDREEELRDSQQKADQAYYTILDFEQRKPVIQKELKYLKKLERIRKPRLFRKQAHALIELQASGQYSSITTNDNGSIAATTTPITIKYDGWQFPLGRYDINIDPKGDITIEALDPPTDADNPHPHVGTDGRPCLGNIAADIPKMLGSMRIAEALQVLYEFLCGYNPDGPYERISHFDPTGQYYDEDENPCENCNESCSPYCIFECSENEGRYSCDDCYDQRSDYCFQDCSYNENFSRFKPCEDCGDEGSRHCYLDCQYNEKWLLRCPCDDCEFEQCSSECSYFKKLQTLKEVAKNANAR
jgi:hypothetical protein